MPRSRPNGPLQHGRVISWQLGDETTPVVAKVHDQTHGKVRGIVSHPQTHRRLSSVREPAAQSYQTPGSNRQRTSARYASYDPLWVSRRSSARARPTLQPEANNITRALRTEMLCSR